MNGDAKTNWQLLPGDRVYVTDPLPGPVEAMTRYFSGLIRVQLPDQHYALGHRDRHDYIDRTVMMKERQ